MGTDDRSGPPLAYFAAGVAIDHLPADVVGAHIREHATAVFPIGSIRHGGQVPWPPVGRPTWFVVLGVDGPDPLGRFSRGTIRSGERGALLVVFPDDEPVALMGRAEVVEVK